MTNKSGLLVATLLSVVFLLGSSTLDAQHIQSPESPNFSQDCVLGLQPAMGIGSPCAIITPAPSRVSRCKYHAMRTYWAQWANEISGTRMFFTGTVKDHRWDYVMRADADADADRIEFLPCIQDAIRSFSHVVNPDGTISKQGLYGKYAVVTSSHAGYYSYVGSSSKDSDWGIYFAVLTRLGLTQAGKMNCANPPTEGEIPGVTCTRLVDVKYEDKVGKIDSWTNSDTFYFDNECKLVSPTAVKPDEVCGPVVTMAGSGSPVSLILDERVDIDANATVVEFDIDPSRPGVYTWKASEGAPLLVWDPKKSGQVTSAAQLFGEWTFGGKDSANDTSDPSMWDGAPVFKNPWKNGYEAMAVLDANKDSELSGSELVPLALWFDTNRNGISEQGEVRPLEKSGITKLFFSPDRIDPKTRSIHASKGYERVIDGRITHGRSVDWYGEQATSVGEVLDRLEATDPKDALVLDGGAPSDDETSSSSLSPAHAKILPGAWIWAVNEPKESFIREGATGNLIFAKDGASAALRGVSIQEQAIYGADGSRSDALKSRAAILRLGNFKSVSDTKFTFEYHNGDGSKVASAVEIKGDRLIGTSTSSGKGTTSITYGWVAEKMK